MAHSNRQPLICPTQRNQFVSHMQWTYMDPYPSTPRYLHCDPPRVNLELVLILI